MKDRFIDIIDGVVAVDSIAAILCTKKHADEGGCTVILKSGGHVPSPRSYGSLAAEFQDLLNSSPFEGVMPDMVNAFKTLKQSIASSDDPKEPTVDTGLKDH